jgi:hypothetical protein
VNGFSFQVSSVLNRDIKKYSMNPFFVLFFWFVVLGIFPSGAIRQEKSSQTKNIFQSANGSFHEPHVFRRLQAKPTSQPSSQPSVQPSRRPSMQPSAQPTSQPSRQPTRQPTSRPTMQPSQQPTSNPSYFPTHFFSYTGEIQNFTIPASVYQISVDINGAAGGSYGSYGVPGYGARVQATIPVAPGTVLFIFVGGQGYVAGCYYGNEYAYGGWNGGGQGAFCSTSGGGSSDIRIGGTGFVNRIVVAGGGGGYYWGGGCDYQRGGHGGEVGVDGSGGCGFSRGGGGTATSGGTAGNYGATAGSFGQGGDGFLPNTHGGGGGGYFGGKWLLFFQVHAESGFLCFLSVRRCWRTWKFWWRWIILLYPKCN